VHHARTTSGKEVSVIDAALGAAGFRQNPFRIVPPAEMDNVIWAGDTTIINELLEAARSPRADALGTSELVVLFGEYGSGKTNALKYLTKIMLQDGALVAYLVRPSVADKPTWHDMARSLFTQAFRKEDVAERLSPLRKYVMVEASKRAREDLGEAADTSPDELEAIKKIKIGMIAGEILPEAPGFVRFAIDLAQGRKDDNWRYLADKPNAALGKEVSSLYNLPADGLATDYGATLLLSSLVRVLTFPTPHGVGAGVVCILMDEAEGFLDIPPASRLSILQGIRELFDACTEHLFMALAATASDASELWGILDTPLMQRLSRQPTQFPQLEPIDAKEFLLGVMDLYRPKGWPGSREWPFTADGIEAFVQACPPLITPRKLLVSAARLIFQKKIEQVKAGGSVDAEDLFDFNAWGAN
jgi:hypothetical protein